MRDEALGLSHNSVLPAALVEKVPHNEKLVLSFVLSYLELQSQPAQLFVNGGYVRDLLQGKVPDDLDLCLCLRECAPAVSIDTVMDGLQEFATSRPDLSISSVQVTTILSDTSKDKNVDTAKAHMVVQPDGERIEVDFMPTIGTEQYEDTDRVPLRDVRGTPEQDALRRDLTINAMLLHVTRGSHLPPAAAAASAAESGAARLEWRLLDFYGGLGDLRDGVLRSPYPASRSLAEVWSEVMRTDDDVAAATALGLAPSAVPSSGVEEAARLQVVWWVKVMRDDPLRVLRALRFSAKLGFGLHNSFWLAVPFALSSLQTKVAGSRKVTELLKLSKAGREPMLDFLQLSFGRSLPTVPGAAEGADAADVCAVDQPCPPLPCGAHGTLAPALFGGADPKGVASFLCSPRGFEPSLMRSAAAALPASLSEDEAFGSGLAAAAFACTMPWGNEDVDAERAADADAAAADAADAALVQVRVACDGLCASNDVRASAETPLFGVASLLRPRPALGMSALFAGAAGAGGGDEFAQLVGMWEALKLEKVLQGQQAPGYRPEFVASLAATRCSAETAARLRASLDTLLTPGVSVNGRALVGIERLPNHLRGAVISHIHVLARLRRQKLEIASPEQLAAYLNQECGGLLDRLASEWYAPDGTLREAYAPARPVGKKRK